jgi:hippurate hydrolase
VEALFFRAVHATAEAQGGSAEISYRHAYPPTINTAAEVDRAVLGAARVVGAENIRRNAKPLLAGEDFAFMLNKVPGAYLIFGQREGDTYNVPLHNTRYDFNDALLPKGAGFFAELVEQELA